MSPMVMSSSRFDTAWSRSNFVRRVKVRTYVVLRAKQREAFPLGKV